MKKIGVFINGFGRIGRAALRIMIEDESIEVVGINDIYDFQQMAALFAHDSIYGSYHEKVTLEENILHIGEKAIRLYAIKEPSQLILKEVDVLLQCTGIFLDHASNSHYLKQGVKKVIISAPAHEEIPTYVMQVNHQAYKDEAIISNSSCSANALVPIMTIIQEAYGIENASMSMFHSYTAYQKLLDVKHYSKDIRRSRAATQNIQPLMSSAARECEKFFPHLKEKLYAKSIRIPVSACTLYDITLKLTYATDKESVNELFIKKSYNDFKDMLAIAHDDAVSRDFIGNRHGAIIDVTLTQVMDGDLLKVFAWQDNEYGYAYQLVRMVKELS